MPLPTADMLLEVDSAPVPALGPETPPTQVRVRFDREYVAGGDWGTLSSFIRTLPPYIDDIEGEFGDGQYDEIQRDPHVAADLNVLKAAVLEEGVSLSPAVPDQGDANHGLSVEICDAATRMFDELQPALADALWDMSDAMAKGHRVAELTYRVDQSYLGRPILVLDRMTVKDRRSTALVVDPYMKLLGVLGTAPGQGTSIQTSTRLDELVKLPNFLPREKFALWTNRPRNNDPRGTSMLRPVYNAWWLKKTMWASYLKYLVQFGSPSLVGEAAPGAQSMPQTDSNGNVVLDPATGQPVLLTPEDALLLRLLQFQSGTAMAIPNGARVTAIETKGEGQVFTTALSLFNAEITKGILTQSLATEEGKHSTRAAAGVHKDILDTLIRQIKQTVVRMLRMDILRHWVRWNWGDAAAQLVPVVSLGDTEREDFGTKAAGVAELTKAGFLHRSQFAAIDSDMGLPPRAPDWMTDDAPILTQVSVQRTPAQVGEGLPTPPAAQPAAQPEAKAA